MATHTVNHVNHSFRITPNNNSLIFQFPVYLEPLAPR